MMASFREVGGQVRAEIRRLGYYKSANFPTREAAELWAKSTERQLMSAHRKARASRDHAELNVMKGCLNLQEILDRSVAAASLSGVYILINDGAITYIGQSMNAHVRVLEHVKNGRPFTHYTVISVPFDHLDEWESKYIAKYQPSGNRDRRGRLIMPNRFVGQ